MGRQPAVGPSQRGVRTAKKLTVRGIKAAKHTGASYGEDGRGAKQEIQWDSEVPGLGLRIYPSGRRSWCLRYRVGGRRRIRALGPLGVYTLETARDNARALLVELKETGKDPLARPQKVPTIRELSRLYLENRKRDVKASTLDTYRAKLQLVEQALGQLAVDTVAPDDVERAFARWTQESGPTAANQALRLLRCLLDLAAKKNYRDSSIPNPAAFVTQNRTQSPGRALTSQELERVGRELERELAERSEAADTVAAIRLLVLTGARRREITSLKWSEVDLDQGCLWIADSKTGAKSVPLNSHAKVLLSELPRVVDEERVFPATRHEVSYAVQYTWCRVRGRAGIPTVRLHDLRHTFVTRGLAANYSEAMIGKIIGHKSAASTRRYEHLHTDPVREANERIGAELAADLDRRESGQVVGLRPRN